MFYYLNIKFIVEKIEFNEFRYQNFMVLRKLVAESMKINLWSFIIAEVDKNEIRKIFNSDQSLDLIDSKFRLYAFKIKVFGKQVKSKDLKLGEFFKEDQVRYPMRNPSAITSPDESKISIGLN